MNFEMYFVSGNFNLKIILCFAFCILYFTFENHFWYYGKPLLYFASEMDF